MRTCNCPMCGGPPMILGQLGNLLWMRCRNCGMDFNRKQPPRRKRANPKTAVGPVLDADGPPDSDPIDV